METTPCLDMRQVIRHHACLVNVTNHPVHELMKWVLGLCNDMSFSVACQTENSGDGKTLAMVYYHQKAKPLQRWINHGINI